ncbi:HlyD family secretion protein [Alkanindiges sp. WGS2144]|uniref:HlyD family secretion protein n=1 Tax=Alkanindiges sp. WGS2144 TaxID=3366808 RepID=UPI0037507221
MSANATNVQSPDPQNNAQNLTADQPDTAEQQTDIAPNKRKQLPKIILAIFLIMAVIGFIYYVMVYRFYESTDNAYLKADVTWVSPRIAGEVTQLNVKNNQQVKAGQVLMQLDDRDIQARYQQAAAITELKQAALGIQRQNIAGQQAMIAEARANLDAANAEMMRLKKDYDRYQQLLGEGITTRQRLETVQSQYLSAVAQVKRAQAGVSAAEAQLAGIEASREQLLADVSSARANVDLIQVDASSAKVVAPISGTIGSLGVRLGSRVSSQTRLLAIVPLEKTFVEANFKETQITNMKVGQKVSIKLDAYPDYEFTGHIDSFSPASGAEFSLLPPENATGNFNKVVQRVPVKILINHKKGEPVLRPGLSARIKVDLRS